MERVIVAFEKEKNALYIRDMIEGVGLADVQLCRSGMEVRRLAGRESVQAVICGYKLADMVYSQLRECLPEGFEMLLMASDRLLKECGGEGIVCLSMPLKVNDLISTVGMMEEGIVRRRRKARLAPKVRSAEEEALLKEAKGILMARNHLTEGEAHRYLQKCSMDSGTNLVETAAMVLSMMKA